jgi:hypothetical protein
VQGAYPIMIFTDGSPLARPAPDNVALAVKVVRDEPGASCGSPGDDYTTSEATNIYTQMVVPSFASNTEAGDFLICLKETATAAWMHVGNLELKQSIRYVRVVGALPAANGVPATQGDLKIYGDGFSAGMADNIRLVPAPNTCDTSIDPVLDFVVSADPTMHHVSVFLPNTATQHLSNGDFQVCVNWGVSGTADFHPTGILIPKLSPTPNSVATSPQHLVPGAHAEIILKGGRMDVNTNKIRLVQPEDDCDTATPAVDSNAFTVVVGTSNADELVFTTNLPNTIPSAAKLKICFNPDPVNGGTFEPVTAPGSGQETPMNIGYRLNVLPPGSMNDWEFSISGGDHFGLTLGDYSVCLYSNDMSDKELDLMEAGVKIASVLVEHAATSPPPTSPGSTPACEGLFCEVCDTSGCHVPQYPVDPPQPNGNHIIQMPNGGLYVGDFVNSLKSGQGMEVYPNGDMFVGQYEHGKREGYGVMTSAQGDERSYMGEYHMGRRHGIGMVEFRNGNTFEGHFKDGRREGQGTFKFVNGDVFAGEYDGTMRTGHGVFVRHDGLFQDAFWAQDTEPEAKLGTGPRPTYTMHIGCVADGPARDLPVFMTNAEDAHANNPLRPFMHECEALCRSARFGFFGLQHGDQCYCGNDYGRLKLEYSDQARRPDEECDVPCPDMPHKMCGGKWRNDVFRIGGTPLDHPNHPDYQHAPLPLPPAGTM